MRSEVFINYRRADGAAYGALLYVVLSEYFGADLVFMASMSIPAGHDFADELMACVRRASVLLAVIGPEWLTVPSRSGGRRIDDAEDWVRRELVEARAAGVRVIPVLTDGARLPAECELPAELAWLARCQYRWLRTRDVLADLERLRRDLAAASPRLAAARRGRIWSLPLTWVAYLAGWTPSGGQRRSIDRPGAA